MKKLLPAVVIAIGLAAQDAPPQITVVDTVTADDAPGVEVQFYHPSASDAVFRVVLEYETESGRAMRMSRLVDHSARGSRTGNTMFSVLFETGVCKVKRARVIELGAVKENSQSF